MLTEFKLNSSDKLSRHTCVKNSSSGTHCYYCSSYAYLCCVIVALAFSKHYRKVGQSVCGLARSFELDDRPGSFSMCAFNVYMLTKFV